MKTLKLFLLVLSFVLLAGCSTEEPEDIYFDNADFEHVGITDDDYVLYRDGGNHLEIKIDDEGNIIASYERYQDIFLILGTEDNYIIRKNGTIILACSGEEIVCAGSEQVGFSDDIDVLYGVFEEEGVSITLIVLGVLIITAAISLFFVPKRFLDKIKIRNIKIGQLLILRITIQ